MKPCVLVCQNDNGFSCLIARTLRKKNISGVYKIHPSKSRPAQTGGIAKLKTNQLNRQNITNSACTKQGQDLKKKKKKKVQGHQLHTMPMMLIMQREEKKESKVKVIHTHTHTHTSHALRESNPMRTKLSNKLHE